MGKRSDGAFERRPQDHYPTPYGAVLPLIPFLKGVRVFAEPCAGDGDLVRHLESFGLKCGYSGDITQGLDALKTTGLHRYDAIISNTPWDRKILHPMIEHFQRQCPTWLLFDADWAHTRQAAPFLPQCSHIVAVGRVKWIPGSPHTGKDNSAWFRFFYAHTDGPRFYGRQQKETTNGSQARHPQSRRDGESIDIRAR